MNITGKQCKAARGLLKWNLRELEFRSTIRASAIEGFEDGSKPLMGPQREVLYKTFKKEGIVFLDMGDVKLVEEKKGSGGHKAHGNHRTHEETYFVDADELLGMSDQKYRFPKKTEEAGEHSTTID